MTYNKRCDYWVVDIQCKDRQKLLFDTVCTLADMGYDVYHATIDGEHANAHQEVNATPRVCCRLNPAHPRRSSPGKAIGAVTQRSLIESA